MDEEEKELRKGLDEIRAWRNRPLSKEELKEELKYLKYECSYCSKRGIFPDVFEIDMEAIRNLPEKNEFMKLLKIFVCRDCFIEKIFPILVKLYTEKKRGSRRLSAEEAEELLASYFTRRGSPIITSFY